MEQSVAISSLLNVIEKKNGQSLFGVIDYISTKHVYFFDFSKTTPDMILLAATWKMEQFPSRFSVYCITNYPDLKLPPVLLIPKIDINKADMDLQATKRTKQRTFAIKKKSAKN